MSKAGFNQKRGAEDRNPPDLLLVMRLVFVLTNNFTKTDPPNGYRLFLLPSIPFPNMRALDRAGYELNTIGSFEVCPTNNWRRMLERKGQFVEGENWNN